MINMFISHLANVLNTSATIFETMSDVDSRFVKLADKECDSLSAEVKKWFKKLAVCSLTPISCFY